MPLRKPGSSAVATPLAPFAAAAAQAEPLTTPVASTVAPKAAPKQPAPKGIKLDKEEYWTRREERDIETGKRIRRSGVWQAALQSMAGLQFNQGGTLETFLNLVDQIADRGLGYVNKD